MDTKDDFATEPSRGATASGWVVSDPVSGAVSSRRDRPDAGLLGDVELAHQAQLVHHVPVLDHLSVGHPNDVDHLDGDVPAGRRDALAVQPTCCNNAT